MEIIPIQSFVETVLKLVKTKWVNDLNKVGLQIAKAENEIYVFVHKGEEIFRGTKKEAKEALEDYFKKGDEIGLEKYLDEVAEATKIRKTAFAKWASKFEKKFHHHFDGEFTIGRFSKRDATQILKGHGGHNHSVIGDNIRIRRYLSQPINNHPFEVLIDIRYKNGQWIEKQAKSSMFPENWNIERVKEEIALVYDKMIDSGVFEQIKNHRTPSFKSLDSNGIFEIKIEFDEFGNITNAYPNI